LVSDLPGGGSNLQSFVIELTAMNPVLASIDLMTVIGNPVDPSQSTVIGDDSFLPKSTDHVVLHLGGFVNGASAEIGDLGFEEIIVSKGSLGSDEGLYPNAAPTNLQLSITMVDESQPAGALVGQLSSSDPDGDSLTFSLVSGEGDEDNAAFKINGNVLETNAVLDYETKYLHYVRIAADDGNGGRVEQSFVIEVTNTFIPIVKTLPAGEVTHEQAELSGQLLADGTSPVTEMGVMVSRDWWFSESDSSTRYVPGISTGADFALSVGQLDPATRYYYRAYATNGEGISLGAKKSFTTSRAAKTDPWDNAGPIGEGWFHLSWFGTFRPFENGWIFHQELGWAYVSGTSENSIWLWTKDWGWLWTSAEAFPHFHSHAQQGWLYYLSQDASGKPVFFDYGLQQWLNVAP